MEEGEISGSLQPRTAQDVNTRQTKPHTLVILSRVRSTTKVNTCASEKIKLPYYINSPSAEDVPHFLRVAPGVGFLGVDVVHGNNESHKENQSAGTAHGDVEDVRRRIHAPDVVHCWVGR